MSSDLTSGHYYSLPRRPKGMRYRGVFVDLREVSAAAEAFAPMADIVDMVLDAMLDALNAAGKTPDTHADVWEIGQDADAVAFAIEGTIVR